MHGERELPAEVIEKLAQVCRAEAVHRVAEPKRLLHDGHELRILVARIEAGDGDRHDQRFLGRLQREPKSAAVESGRRIAGLLALPLGTDEQVASGGEGRLVAFFVLTAFFLVYVPFSKISHYLYYPFTRYYLGKTMGYRGVYPVQRS